MGVPPHQGATPSTSQWSPIGAITTWKAPVGAVTATVRAHSRASVPYWATMSDDAGPGAKVPTGPAVTAPAERHKPVAASSWPYSVGTACNDKAFGWSHACTACIQAVAAGLA